MYNRRCQSDFDPIMSSNVGINLREPKNFNTLLCHFYTKKGDILSITKIIMEGRNCPNCGAPLKADICKCPYCGTSYFDISAINISEREPFYLKLRLNAPDGGYDIITAFVCADPSLSITCEQDTLYCWTANKGYIPSHVSAQYEFEMNFHTVNRHFDDEPIALTVEHVKNS